MINLNGLIQHFESKFKKKGKDFRHELNENIQILKNVKDDVSATVSRIFGYDIDIKPNLVLGITPFHDETEDPAFAVALTARLYHNLTPENFRKVEPQYAICINPLSMTAYIEERGFSDKKEQFIKGLLAEEFSHLAIEEKYGSERLQLELYCNKTFKGKKVPILYVLDYIYILRGKSEACAMYVANQVAGIKIYTPKQISKEVSNIRIGLEDYLSIGGRLGTYLEKMFAASILDKIKDEKDFRKFLQEIDEVTVDDIYLFENPPNDILKME